MKVSYAAFSSGFHKYDAASDRPSKTLPALSAAQSSSLRSTAALRRATMNAMESGKPLLKVSGVSVSFDGEPVLNDLNFELAQGEALAIIGPNGAGKTVFLRALLGTVRYAGTIAWAKEAHVGYVPQKIDADRHLPINFENLLTAKSAVIGKSRGAGVGGNASGTHSTGSSHSMENVIETVGLTKKILQTPVGHLSGGQFQRALIAFALLGNPNVLILDEPTASIDKPGEEQMYELIHRLQDKLGITVIVVSHDLSFVYRYATKVLCLYKSGICFGTPEEALTPEVLEKLYGPHKYYHHFHDGMGNDVRGFNNHHA